ncbi:MAG: hypothetical protein JWQ27_766 [Ferruginibacter sp.]|nr:hypothetical protein [Ferruginibacter sp.]
MINNKAYRKTADEFVVNDSILMLLFIGLAFTAMVFFAALYTDAGEKNYLRATLCGLIPAILVTLKIMFRKPVIIINRVGIYVSGKLITDWQHFANAHVSEEDRTMTFRDNFVLIVHYRKDGYEGFYKSTIPLTSTQDKTQEQILEAVYGWYVRAQNTV